MNLIDTNVILRYFIGDRSEYKGVFNLFSKLNANEEKVECTLLVFFQVIFVLKSFYKVSTERIANIMTSFINIPGVFIKEKRILKSSLSKWSDYGGDIIDAYLVSVSDSGHGRKIYSLDEGMDKMTQNRIAPI